MNPTPSDVSGLELALQQWNKGGPAAHFAAQLRGLIAQAKAAPAESVLGEPVGHVYTMQPCFPGEPMRAHAQLHKALPAGTKLYTATPSPDADHIPDAAKMVDAQAHKYAKRAAGQLDAGVPGHTPTIAINELLAGHLPDDREDHWEAIQAYADIRAAGALEDLGSLLAKGGDQ